MEQDKSNISFPRRTIPFLGETTCEQIDFFKINRGASGRGAFMVSSCPPTWEGDGDVKYRCENTANQDILDFIPVYDRKNNMTFRNRQCALCHDVHQWTPWLLNVTCASEFYLNHDKSSSSFTAGLFWQINSLFCDYQFEHSDDIHVRFCYIDFDYDLWNIVKNINTTSCNNRVFSPFLMRVRQDFKMFRNVQCLKNEIDPISLREGHSICFDTTAIPYQKDSPTISNLIDISPLFHAKEIKSQCTETEILLNGQIGCQTLYCPVDKEPVDGTCVAVKYKTTGIILDLLFETNAFPLDFTLIEITLQEILRNEISTSEPMDYFQTWSQRSTFFSGFYTGSMEPCTLIQYRCAVFKTLYSGSVLETTRSRISTLFGTYQQNLSNGTYIKHINNIADSLCEDNASMFPIENPLYVVNKRLYRFSIPCPAVKVYLFDNYTEVNYSNSGSLNTTKYQRIFALNGTLIDPADVFQHLGSYFVCVDDVVSKYKDDNKNTGDVAYFRYVANTICNSVSILSLIYTLTHYCYIPFLRQGKSELLILLMLYLLIAQSTFLLLVHVTLPSDVCEWVGVLHHFVWIGTFILMFLCSYRLNSEIRSLLTTYTLQQWLAAPAPFNT
ncbi:uncharacterized protein [Argopecten irradians]|uniref:uncharacterized protein n=1 Tax=Argopecten irradians TaxID=31199 RepID=UPI0037144A74